MTVGDLQRVLEDRGVTLMVQRFGKTWVATIADRHETTFSGAGADVESAIKVAIKRADAAPKPTHCVRSR